MRDWRDVFNQFHVQASRLQCRDGAFATASGAFDANFHVTHSKLAGFFGGLLSRTLTGKGRAFSAAFESAGTSTRPTKRVAFGVRDGDGRVVERCMNVSNAAGDIASDAFFLVCLCHGKGSLSGWVKMNV